jgi:hypothetical protein
MIMNSAKYTRLLLLFTAALAACSPQFSAPSPSTLTGRLDSAGYVMHRWDQGISILLFFERPAGYFCESSSGSTDSESVTECTIDTASGREIRWQIRSSDGKGAGLTISGDHFDIDGDALFLIHTDGPGIRVEKLNRELSAIIFENQAISQFAGNDNDIQSFLESLK